MFARCPCPTAYSGAFQDSPTPEAHGLQRLEPQVLGALAALTSGSACIPDPPMPLAFLSQLHRDTYFTATLLGGFSPCIQSSEHRTWHPESIQPVPTNHGHWIPIVPTGTAARGTQHFCQDHTARRRQSWDSNPRPRDTNIPALYHSGLNITHKD